jgi:ATP/maltotriose-dependent transcriptional regulator MalT
MLAGDNDPEYAERALQAAEALGLGELRAHVLITLGTARGNAGDYGGHGDIMRGLESARAGRWLYAIVRGCANLGTQHARDGRVADALALAVEGDKAARQLGNLVQARFARTGLVLHWFEAGDWARAAPEAERYLADSGELGPGHDDGPLALVRACMRVARDDVDGALADLAFATEHAHVSWEDPQLRWPVLAASTSLQAELGRLDEAAASLDELLSPGRVAFDYIELGFADVVGAAHRLGRGDRVRAALAATPGRPAADAGCALLDGDAARGAEIYEAAGAAYSAAIARLRFGHTNPELLEAALAFFARVDATRYQRECGRLLRAPV